MNSRMAAVRIDEFKLHLVVQLQDAISSRGNKGGFSGTIAPETGGVTAVNLYTIPLGQEASRYGVVLAKYPPRIPVVMPGRSK